MESENQRKPTIILKFKNSTVAKKHSKSDYSDDDDEVGQKYLQFGADCDAVKKDKMMTSGGGGSGKRETAVNNDGMVPPSFCQVDNCAADLTAAKHYHRRHRVCEVHAKASVVVVVGLRQRFCQQCSRFHEVSEFDDVRRSCRNRLAGHNERRRKSYSEATQVIKGEQSKSRSRSRSRSRPAPEFEFESGW